jgi:hypothetical protein
LAAGLRWVFSLDSTVTRSCRSLCVFVRRFIGGAFYYIEHGRRLPTIWHFDGPKALHSLVDANDNVVTLTGFLY